jgi:5-methylcytosine-specific restriction endonuclease McrA
MSGDVLVLNRSFYAIHITSWQRALSLLYIDHAAVVDGDYHTYSFEDWRQISAMTKDYPAGFINTPNFKIAIPEVIALKLYDHLPTTEVKFTRRNIYEHYGYRCCYCGNTFASPDLNLEHVIPRSRGGKTSWSNIVTSCIPCNLKKGNKLPSEAGMELLIKPSKPKWRGSISLMLNSPVKIRSSWQRFIDSAYWNGELDRE